MQNYNSYVYIWYDTKAKFFYIGGHKGKIEDNYICSSKTMLKAYKLRPETFKFKVLEYVNGSLNDLRLTEQKWLNKIKPHELMNSENVKNKTCKYYNVKKFSSGGNGSANKGNSNIGGWNKGLTMSPHSKDTKHKMSIKRKEYWENKKKLFILTCKECSTPFMTKKIKRNFCSKSCASKNHHEKNRVSCLGKKEQLTNPPNN